MLHAFFKIYQIGTEQDLHSISLRKSIFAVKLTRKDGVPKGGENSLNFAELCADHLEKYDSYPRALFSMQIPPKTFYAVAGYIVTALASLLAMQSNIH